MSDNIKNAKLILTLASHLRFGPANRRASLLGLLAVMALTRPVSAQIQITQQPTSKSVGTNANVLFQVVAQSPLGLSYQWKLNGVNIPGAKSNTFNLFTVKPADAGSYNVSVSDANGALDSAVATLLITNILVLPFSDDFPPAGSLGPSKVAGVGRGSNFNATVQSGEPPPDNIPGGASVWIKWQPPASGIATLSLAGSGFDTILGVYTGADFTNLVAVAGDDDNGGYLTSAKRFNVPNGGNETYYIQVDGAYGDVGNIVLAWNLEITADRLPVIVTQPVRQTASPGSDVVLTVETQPGVFVQYQWFFDDAPLDLETGSTLVIPTVGPQQLGRYKVSVTDPQQSIPRTVFSDAVSVQINSDSTGQGDPQVVAQDKFRAEADPNSGFKSGVKRLRNKENAAPAGGFTGTQVFSTYGSMKEPGEPNHCGEPGGASHWFSYLPPLNGTLKVDTIGSTFNNVVAIYTGPGDSFATLVPVSCSNTNNIIGGVAANGEVANFPVTGGTVYYIATDGVGGVTGTVNLDYNLVSPPAIAALTPSQTLSNGANITLAVSATGSPTLNYQWQFNGTNIGGANLNSLTIGSFQNTNQGVYTVLVGNNGGSITSAPVALYLNTPYRLTNSLTTGGLFSSQLLAKANSNYVIQASTDLVNWVPLQTNNSPLGIITFTDLNTLNFSNRFYRARTN